jgi:hypothetical protein
MDEKMSLGGKKTNKQRYLTHKNISRFIFYPRFFSKTSIIYVNYLTQMSD